METDSDTFPMYMKGICGELIVDSAENIPSNSSSEERDRGSLQAVVYAMDSSKVEVLDSTVAESQRNCCTEKFHPDCSQRIKELRSVFIGCGSLEEEELNVKGLMSEYTHEEPGLETSHQWEKDRTNVEPPKTEKAGVLGHCRNGVLPVYYVYKSSVIQLLKACDPDIQPGLLQCLEDTSERVTWNNSLSAHPLLQLNAFICCGCGKGFSDSSTLFAHRVHLEDGQFTCSKCGQHFEAKFSCSNELDQCQKDQELEEVPCKQPDFCSDQAIVRKQHVVRRQRNNQSSTVPTTRIAIPQLSSEEIRIIVYTSFKDILIHRLQETSDLNLNENAVRAVSADIEKELFKLFYCTNTRYKNKYRSLMFNLKDPKNTHLFRQVLQGDITPQCLVLMSPTELASLELMEWRKREYKHSIKLTTTESDEFERKPLSKLTHKGEIEIEKDLDQNLTLEDLMDTSPKSFGHAELSVSEKNSIIDTTHQHRSHLLDPNCQICSAPLAAPVKSRVRRAKESCMASNLLNLAPDISVDERTLLESKCVSQMENTAGLPNPTKYPAAFKRFHPQTHAVWKGFIQMSNMKQFLVKAYPVLGLTDHLTKALSTTITVGKCVLPELIWDSVDRLHCSGKKEMCLVRFKPATRGDVCPYSLYYSYLNSRQKYGAVVLERKSPNSMYLIPLPALQKIPSRLPPLSGPGLESSHSDLLLALTFPKKQHSSSIFRKLYECRGRTDRYFQENKCRQKCTENINKEHLSDYSSAKRGAQPCTLPILPTLPFTQPRECQDKPLDLLSGNLLSTEEQSSSTDLADNLAVEICQSSCWTGQDQESDGIGNIFGASDFLDDWVDDGQNENFDTNELEHHVAGKESESMTRSKMFNIETNLLAHFKPADILPENFLCSETQLNSTLQQEDESKIERNELINDQEADGAVNAQYSQDMPTYIKELDKLFKNVPVSVFSQHEDCNQLHSTISCCAEVLNCLLSTSDSSLATELQIQMGPHEDQHNTTASQEGSEHIPRSVSPLPLHSPQIPNNFQHLGHSGTLNLEPRVPLPALLSDEVTMEQVEAPFQNRSTSIFPFKFNFYDETGIDAELHQLPRPHSFSPYCPIHHQHYTNVHMDTCQVQQCSQAFSHTAVIESRKVQ